MTKKELAQSIQQSMESKHGEFISQPVLLNLIDVFAEEVTKELKLGGTVYLRGFGRFEPKVRKAKKAQLITEGKTIDLPETIVPKFKPYKTFKEAVK